jgi:hypothetical protein
MKNELPLRGWLRVWLKVWLLCGALLHAGHALADPPFAFGVLAGPRSGAEAETQLRTAIAGSDADNLAFVVALAVKAGDEACSERLYRQRKDLLDSAKNGLIVSLAASDWTECRDADGRLAPVAHLTRLRELFFADLFSLGATRMPLVRQSARPRYRNYPENSRWEVGEVLFATLDLPANNNDYRFEAGRNSEFEDRLIADRNWLHQAFTYAKYRKLRGIVLFCDGNPFAPHRDVKRDGYAEIRRQLLQLARGFSGRVLVVHGDARMDSAGAVGIAWQGRVGAVGTTPPWMRITVNPGAEEFFLLDRRPAPRVS